jgi:uncharacterized protein YcgL (UPF0745 family)
MKCVIFRCSKKDEMYLYAPYQEDEHKVIEGLPDGLITMTGKLTKAMDLELTPDKKLARANAKDVIASLEEKGFYLQMPPNDVLRADESMLSKPSDGF